MSTGKLSGKGGKKLVGGGWGGRVERTPEGLASIIVENLW